MTCPPHHWLLPMPDGATVEGRCKRCGARRTYAVTSDSDIGQWSTSAQQKRMHADAVRRAKNRGAL